MSTNAHESRAATLPSARDDWRTPVDRFAKWHAEFRFTVDAAADADNALLPNCWTREANALALSWRGERIWCNPPFGRQIGAWVEHAYYETNSGGCPLAVLLVPVRSDTAWWHDHVEGKAEVRLLRGRLRFTHPDVTHDNSAPFPCALLIYRAEVTP